MGTLKVNGNISATGNISASSFLGNASSASKWATARTIKIGKTGKSVDGSSNVSWTHYEIGVPYCYDTSPTDSPAYSHWGMLISRGENKYGQSGTEDNYFIGVNSNSQLHIGHQLNGTSIITWTNILSEHNYSSYALPLSGGTMTGSPVIKFPASQGSIATSDPMAITYGRISAYGTLCINADSDGSTNEYLILTSGRGLSSSVADGLAIGYNTLTWQNNTIIHSGNYTTYTVTKTGSGASGTWGINVTGSAGSVAWGNVTGKPSLMPGTPGSIELFPGSSAGHGGFIDFHYNNSSSDYTARLINWNGKLQVDGATFNVGGKVELWTDGEGGNIRITSPNGSLWSIDALENSKLRFIWAEAQVPFSFQHDGVFNCAAIATSAWGPSLPGSGYWGQVYFKT